MPVIWDATKVEKWDEVDPALKTTIDFQLMEVGFGTITEANAREVFDRISFVEKIHGPYRNAHTEDGLEPYFTKPSEIRMLIGYSVNVSNKAVTSFRTKVWKDHVSNNTRKWDKD